MQPTDFLYITNSSLNILLHIIGSRERFHASHVLFEFYLVPTPTTRDSSFSEFRMPCKHTFFGNLIPCHVNHYFNFHIWQSVSHFSIIVSSTVPPSSLHHNMVIPQFWWGFFGWEKLDYQNKKSPKSRD